MTTLPAGLERWPSYRPYTQWPSDSALTDTKGREVDNPVFEFDACFDPKGDTTATGTVFESVLNVASTFLPRRPDGTVDVQLVCGSGAHGCGGTIAASAGSTDLGRFSYDLKEEQAATIRVPKPVPADAVEVTFTCEPKAGLVPPKPVTVPTAWGSPYYWRSPSPGVI